MPLTLLCIACAMPGDISLSSLLLQNVQVLLNLCTTKEKYAVKQYFLPQKEQHTLYNQLLYNMAIKSFNEFLSKPLTTTMKTQIFAFLFACNSRALATSSPNFPTLQVSRLASVLYSCIPSFSYRKQSTTQRLVLTLS